MSEVSVEKIIKALMDKNHFFETFNENDMLELLKCCSTKQFHDGEIIFKEGDRGRDFYIITSGSIMVTKRGQRIDNVRDGECIGEMGALTGTSRSADAEAIGRVVALSIDEYKLDSLSPDIRAKLFKNIIVLISQRLRKRLERVR